MSSVMTIVLLPWLGVMLIITGAILSANRSLPQASGPDADGSPPGMSALRGKLGGLLIALGLLVVVAPPLVFALQSFQHVDEQDRLRQTGVSAPATILAV